MRELVTKAVRLGILVSAVYSPEGRKDVVRVQNNNSISMAERVW